MKKHVEPSIRGRKKKAKAKRKALFDKVYRILEVGEVVQSYDREFRNGYMHRIHPRKIGTVVEPGSRGRYRRRIAWFVPIEEV